MYTVELVFEINEMVYPISDSSFANFRMFISSPPQPFEVYTKPILIIFLYVQRINIYNY